MLFNDWKGAVDLGTALQYGQYIGMYPLPAVGLEAAITNASARVLTLQIPK